MWRDRFLACIDELKQHPDVDVWMGGEVDDPPSAEELDRAEREFGAPLPKGIRELYEELGGVNVTWGHRTQQSVGGIFNIGPALLSFGKSDFEVRAFDYIVDMSPAPSSVYYAGYDPEGDPNQLLWVYYSENEKTPDGQKFIDARPLSLTLEEYLEAMLRSRGFAFWQEAFASPAAQTPAAGNVAVMKRVMPELFSDFDPATFGASG